MEWVKQQNPPEIFGNLRHRNASTISKKLNSGIILKKPQANQIALNETPKILYRCSERNSVWVQAWKAKCCVRICMTNLPNPGYRLSWQLSHRHTRIADTQSIFKYTSFDTMHINKSTYKIHIFLLHWSLPCMVWKTYSVPKRTNMNLQLNWYLKAL